jgi:endonuclease/exonuclease/phosphatase family metal-dependent hydrolase
MSFTVCSYNVNWGNCLTGNPNSQHAKNICKAITSTEADICCLQETHSGFEKVFKSNFETLYPYQIHKEHKYKSATLDNKEGSLAGGLTILSKFPIYEISFHQPKVEGSFFPGLIVRVEVKNNVFVEILNVHLRPPISKEHRPTIGDYFYTSSIRKDEIKELISQMTNNQMKIICGDFNESSGDCLTFLKKEMNYKDILIEHCDNKNTWYWHLFWNTYLYGAYDHIFFDPMKLNSTKGKVFEEFKEFSDHLPVLGEFKF